MGTIAYLLLGLVLLVAVVGRVDLRLRATFASVRAEQARTNAATAEAVGEVQRKLAVGPIPVAVHGERGLRGQRIVLDTGSIVLRLHLYGGSDLGSSRSRRGGTTDTEGNGVTPVFLTFLADEPDRGWRVRLAGLAGTSTYEGWLLERRDVPAVAAGPASRPARPADPDALGPATWRRSTSPSDGGG